MNVRTFAHVALLVLASACVAEDHDDHEHDNEIISRVELTFTPQGGGEALVFAFSDPDGDGGMSGTAERIELVAATTYALDIRLINELASPAEDLTSEVAAEAEEHMIFVLGDVMGPASTLADALVQHAYADLESDYGDNAVGEDLPVGLESTITTDTAGEGQLRVVLRHLPELNGEPQKTSELPASLAAGEDLPGSVDVDVSFELVVQ
jgi:hypothetical protein